jgi:ankyrin repeat protein
VNDSIQEQLILAAIKRDTEMVDRLLAQGVDVNTPGKANTTALMMAATEGFN